MYVEFRNRNFQSTLMPRLLYVPQRFSWQHIGGPETATIHAVGSRAQLYALLNCLRYDVVIRDNEGEAAWWGYIRSVVIYPEGYGATMEGMANRVRIDYMRKIPGRADTKAITSFIQDDDSVTKYGNIERSFTLSQASDAHAAQYAATQLATLKKPLAIVEFGSEDRAFAKIECRGWWSSTGFRFFTRSESQQELANMDTTKWGEQWIGSYHTGTDNIAEPFIASFTGKISEIYLAIAGWNATPLYVEIANDDVSHPNPLSIVGTMNFSGPPAGAYQFYPYAHPTGISVVLGTTYWVYVHCNFDGVNFWNLTKWWHTSPGAAGHGSAQINYGSAWVDDIYSVDGQLRYWHLLTRLNYLVDNATQISDAISAAAEFLTGGDIISTTGVATPTGRAGDYTLQSALEELLTSGTANNRQLLAFVTPERVVRVYEEPIASRQSPGIYRDGNKLYDAQKRPLKANSPTGKWCRDVNIVLPPEADVDPSFFFVARAEYDCRKGQWTSLEARDQQQAFQFGAMV